MCMRVSLLNVDNEERSLPLYIMGVVLKLEAKVVAKSIPPKSLIA